MCVCSIKPLFSSVDNIKVAQGSNLMCSQIASEHNKAVSRARPHNAYFPQDGDDDTIQCDA